jgi:molybdate transport system substrate-binding protein
LRRRVFLNAIGLAAFAAATASRSRAQTRDIVLFADESLKPAIDEANALFLFENAMKVVVSYGASSDLARRIENGASADVFISADTRAMDALAARNMIDPDSRADLVTKTAAQPPVNYPIAILSASTNVLASIYVQYLRSPKATPFFEKAGFVVPT